MPTHRRVRVEHARRYAIGHYATRIYEKSRPASNNLTDGTVRHISSCRHRKLNLWLQRRKQLRGRRKEEAVLRCEKARLVDIIGTPQFERQY